MFKKYHLGGVAAALLVAGCVSQGSFDKLQSEKNQEIEALQGSRTALEGQVRDLEAQRSSLAREKQDLTREKQDLTRQIAELEQQRAQLQAATEKTTQRYDSVLASLNEEVKKGQLQVRQYKDKLTVDVAEQLFFDSGKATLKDTGKQLLQKVADSLKGYEDKAIRIVGHTDNVPITKSLQKVFPSNWELSVARASTVVRFLQDGGIAPDRLIATGRAEYAPVAPNDTVEGRQKNRRIEITLIDRTLVQ
jgi:chemotaxis protein MotB